MALILRWVFYGLKIRIEMNLAVLAFWKWLGRLIAGTFFCKKIGLREHSI